MPCYLYPIMTVGSVEWLCSSTMRMKPLKTPNNPPHLKGRIDVLRVQELPMNVLSICQIGKLSIGGTSLCRSDSPGDKA